MTKDKDTKLIHVEFRYDNGDTKFLEGESADNWLNDINGILFLANGHGWKLKDYQWSTKKQKKE